MRNCVFDGNTASTFFIGSVDIRRHLSVLVEPTKPILAAPFLCSVSHLNEYFSCSHSYIENCSCVFPQPDGWRSRWLLLFPTKATSVPLSPASGYHDLPCYFGFYGNHLFSEASDLFRPSLLLSCNLEVPSPPSFCQRLQGAFLTRVAGRVAVAHWLVSFTSSGGPLQFFFFSSGGWGSVFIRRPLVCRSELNEIYQSPGITDHPGGEQTPKMSGSLHPPLLPVPFTVSQAKLLFTNSVPCSLFWYFPHPLH